MRILFLPLFFTALLSAELINGVSVVVKGEAITLFDIKNEMRLSNVDERTATDMLIRKKLEETEIEERRISVSASDVFEDIKKVAAANNISVDELYKAVRDSNGLSSTEFKEKTKEKLLSQKLYSAIAYASMEAPSDDEAKEYYEMHKEEFMRPSGFKVTMYGASSRELLDKKISNPLFYSADIKKEERILAYDKISPELSKLLQNTKENGFTPVVSDAPGSYVAFFLKEVQNPQGVSFESAKNTIINMIMAQKREQVLGDYFAKVRNNADIKILRKL